MFGATSRSVFCVMHACELLDSACDCRMRQSGIKQTQNSMKQKVKATCTSLDRNAWTV
jgi:hypothetical protein